MLVQNRDTFVVESSTAITVGLVKLCEFLSTTVVHGASLALIYHLFSEISKSDNIVRGVLEFEGKLN